MRYIADPGPWLQYRNKPENQKLSLHEATEKYKHEQMFHSLQNQQSAHAMALGKSKPAFNPGESGRINLRNAATLWESDRQTALAHYGEINTWDVSRVTSMAEVFIQLPTFNSDISNWNTASVTNMTGMFYGATAFNQNISSWNVEAVTSMTSMFQAATSFVQDISDWNPFSLENAAFFLTNQADTATNTTNYNALLVAWGAHADAGDLKTTVGIDFGATKYSGTPATDGRLLLTGAPSSWTITDGGV